MSRLTTATQGTRRIAVSTPLGEDKLLFRRMTAVEEMGRLFQMDLELLSTSADINLDDLLGQNVTVRLQQPDGETRYFNGFVSRFSLVGTEGDLFSYQATLRPWLWFLTRTSDCRIFQEMTAPDIIKEVFRGNGFGDFEESLSGSYRNWEYCVQYRETDFNFVSRLMEQEGIYYYFKHENGKHDLVLSDAIGAHAPVPGYEEVPFYPPEGNQRQRRERDHLWSWNLTQEVQPGAYAINEFDFKKPNASLEVKSVIDRDHDQSGYEIYDYPGEYTERGDGESYSKIRIEELQRTYQVVSAHGNAAGLTTGCLFNLTNHHREDQNSISYLVTSATHELVIDDYESGGSGGGNEYAVSLQAMDSQYPYRPTRVTPKPVVQGPQTAVVVGKSGEEIWTDEHGRVKVQFHWDRYSGGDETSSCWIRVSQGWAGKGWGSMFIPRIGQEVIVDFLEGDPDRPIITGRVYNGSAKPPYSLPAEATKSTIKTNSSKGGGGFNELRFEDKKGDEEIFLHGEKDLEIRVKKDRREIIKRNRHLIVQNQLREKIFSDTHTLIEGDNFEEVEGDVHLTLGADRMLEITGSEHIQVLTDKSEEVTGDNNLKDGGNHAHKVGSKYSLNAGSEVHAKAGKSMAHEAGQTVHIKAGMKVVIEAGVQLSLKVGGSFVNISPAGVDIKGPLVNINSGGSAGSGSGCSPRSPAAPNSPTPPEEPEVAANAKAGTVDKAEGKGHEKSAGELSSTKAADFQNPQAKAFDQAAKDGTPFCEACEKAKKNA